MKKPNFSPKDLYHCHKCDKPLQVGDERWNYLPNGSIENVYCAPCHPLHKPAEAMARYEEKMIIKGLMDEMIEKGHYTYVETPPEMMKQITKDMEEAGIIIKDSAKKIAKDMDDMDLKTPHTRIQLNSVGNIKEAMRRYALTSPHDDCSTPEDKK